MKKEFVVERQGKSFVLYAGLLDEAHSQGLKSITTSLIQSPTDSNGNVAICQAVVETERGSFSGIGDASPANVPSGMVNCTIRMAETRSKARALRDAVNVGVAALEELAEEDYADASGFNPAAEKPADVFNGNGHHYERIASGVPSVSSVPSSMATPAQVRAIYLIAKDQHSLTESQLEEKSIATYGCTPAELTKKQASEFISALRSAPRR